MFPVGSAVHADGLVLKGAGTVVAYFDTPASPKNQRPQFSPRPDRPFPQVVVSANHRYYRFNGDDIARARLKLTGPAVEAPKAQAPVMPPTSRTFEAALKQAAEAFLDAYDNED